jgi:hypothetical protein
MIKKAMGRRPSLHLFPHLFFFISKLTSTREEVDPPAKKIFLKKAFVHVLEPAPYVYIPRPLY